MINFAVGPLCSIISILVTDEHLVSLRATQVSSHGVAPQSGLAAASGLASQLGAFLQPTHVENDEKKRYGDILDFTEKVSARLELDATKHRIKLFRQKLTRYIPLTDFLAEIRALREAIEGDIDERYFHYYAVENARLLMKVGENWKTPIEKFPWAKNDIAYAIDSYALRHYDGTVFYLMKIMERSVQAFGKKLNVNLVKKNPGRRISELSWEQILNDINPKLKGMKQNTTAQKRRFERFSGIQSHLYAVKDAWRNPTMHPREQGYTEPHAREVMNHVQSFMTGLAEVI